MRSSGEEIRERREKLTALIKREGYLSVGQLGQRFSVSEATIRRDLNALEEEKKITRTYGGALSEYDAFFMSFYQRNAQNRPSKKRIARAAAKLIEGGQTVFMDAGSTVFALAETLAEMDLEPFRVVTNSLPSAEALASKGPHEISLLGGRLLPHQLIVVGSGTSLSLSAWKFDLAFLSAQGMTRDGLWNSRDEISDFQRNVCGRTAEAVFCLDDSKVGREAPSFLMSWPQLDRLLTTADRRAMRRMAPDAVQERIIYA